MRNALFLAAFVLALPALAQETAPPQQAENPTIVVTGKSLADTERGIRDCIARNCPPDQEADAVLAHAENQFVSGKYKDALATLNRGTGRLKRFGKQYPVAVSDVFRARSRVAAHLGEGDAYRNSTMDMVSTLRSGLGPDDARTLAARVELGDSFAAFGRTALALSTYSDVARDARRLGLPRIEGYAMFRRAAFFATLSLNQPGEYRDPAGKALDALIGSNVPEHQPFARAAKVLRARLAVRRGEKVDVDALIASLRLPQVTRPTLLYYEPFKMVDVPTSQIGSGTRMMAMNNYEDQWIDVSFWIAPNGSTTEVDILRSSEGYDGSWSKPILDSIRTRRYAPLKLDPSEPGLLRVERYTYTGRWTRTTGTRIRVRDVNARIEMIDLSADEPAKAATQ